MSLRCAAARSRFFSLSRARYVLRPAATSALKRALDLAGAPRPRTAAFSVVAAVVKLSSSSLKDLSRPSCEGCVASCPPLNFAACLACDCDAVIIAVWNYIIATGVNPVFMRSVAAARRSRGRSGLSDDSELWSPRWDRLCRCGTTARLATRSRLCRSTTLRT